MHVSVASLTDSFAVNWVELYRKETYWIVKFCDGKVPTVDVSNVTKLQLFDTCYT